MALQGGLNILLWGMSSTSKIFLKSYLEKDERNPLGFYEK
jgi:hypothetical protein